MLARALTGAGRNPERALTLATAARDHGAASGNAELLEQAEAWLRDHPQSPAPSR